MPRWNDNNVCLPTVINKTLQQIADFDNNNKYSQNPKNQEKSASRKFGGHLNHKLFSENIMHYPLTVFCKPMGAINIRIT